MKQKLTRYLSALLALALVFTMLPLAAFAAEDDVAPAGEPAEDGAAVYTVTYCSEDGSLTLFAEAVEAGGRPSGVPMTDSGAAYVWYTAASRGGSAVEPSEQTIAADVSFYGAAPGVSLRIYREDGVTLLFEETLAAGDSLDGRLVARVQDAAGESVALLALRDAAGNVVSVPAAGMDGDSLTLDGLTASGDIVLTAVEGWRVRYFAGGALLGEEILEKGAAPASVPASCTVDGETLNIAGWKDADGDPLDLGAAPSGSLDAYADLGSDRYTVTYYDADGTTVLGSETVAAGGVPSAAPATNKSGKAVTNWLSSAGAFVILANAAITADCAYTAWYTPGLNSSEHVKYINGIGGGSFAPGQSLTRAQAAKIIGSLLGATSRGPFAASFSDVASGAWYAEAVSVLASYKIITGYSDGTFRPNNNVTRAEFVTMLSRLYTLQSGTSAFTDVSAGKWYYDAVSSAVARGWVNGYSDGSFKPLANITRAEAVAVVNRVLGRSADKNAVDSCGYLLYTDLSTTHWAFYDIMEASIAHNRAASASGESWGSYTLPDCGLEEGLRNLNGSYYYVQYVDAAKTTRALVRYPAGVNKVGSYYYYVEKNGCAISQHSAGVHELGGKLYLFRNNYSLVTDPLAGYDTRVYEYNKKMYYIKNDYSLARNEYVGTLYFDTNGAYTSGNATIDAFCDDVLYNTIHNLALDQEAKLNTAYKLLRDGFTWGGTYCQGYYRNWKAPDYGVTDWSLEACAARMINSYYYSSARGCYVLPGDCYHWAALMVCLMRRLGYSAYRQPGTISGAPHAWEIIDWPDGNKYMFDVEIEWGFRYSYYSSAVYNYDLYFMSFTSAHYPWNYVW